MKSAFNTVSQIGEFGLIERIKKLLPPSTSDDVIIGIGDDTAVIKIDERRSLLATCDIQIEDTHFRLHNISAYQLGRRSMAVNLSDIASMGGKPTFALVSLGLPKDLSQSTFDEIIKGMRDQLSEFNALIIGGNLAHTPEKLIIDIFLLGEVHPKRLLLRSGAKSGDRICVTGTLGASAAGFLAVEQWGRFYPKDLSDLVQAHLQPTPQINAGREIAKSGFATAMIDISDGLASDLLHVCEMSGVGAVIDQSSIPLNKNFDRVGALLKKDPYNLAIHGGEDYELLFTIKSTTPKDEIEKISKKTGTPITEIGVIISKEEGYWLNNLENKKQPLKPKGWNHFIDKEE